MNTPDRVELVRISRTYLRARALVRMSPNPPVRRLKTYTGSQGYVYQYYFVGKRTALADDPESPATEFVFDVTSDRKLTYAVSVFLPESTRAVWSKAQRRAMNE